MMRHTLPAGHTLPAHPFRATFLTNALSWGVWYGTDHAPCGCVSYSCGCVSQPCKSHAPGCCTPPARSGCAVVLGIARSEIFSIPNF